VFVLPEKGIPNKVCAFAVNANTNIATNIIVFLFIMCTTKVVLFSKIATQFKINSIILH
jgi:hypothetical protein